MPRQRDLESLKQKLKRNVLKNNRAELIVDRVLLLLILIQRRTVEVMTVNCQILHFRTT